MISIIKYEDVYQIRFKYDPSLVDLIKNVPGRIWNPNAKMWTVPLDRLGLFINQIKGTSYESQLKIESDENIGINETVDTTSVIPDVDISDIKQYVQEGSKLFRHQIDFLKYAKNRDNYNLRSGFILADEPGAGKTLEYIKEHLHNNIDLKTDKNSNKKIELWALDTNIIFANKNNAHILLIPH